MYYRKWRPSKAAKRDFAKKMDEITAFCKEHDIDYSRNQDSYYFQIKGKSYRVSNHSVEASNAAAYNDIYGQTRDLYHPGGRKEDIIYIHASKTRLIEIYEDLIAGYELDGRGKRKEVLK